MPTCCRSSTLALLIAAAGLAQGVGQGQTGAYIAKIHFRAVDPFGGSFGGSLARNITIDRFKDQKGRDWSRRFKDGHASGIPYGTYWVSARADVSLTEFSERIDVGAPEVLVTAAFCLSAPEVGGWITTGLGGRVEDLPKSSTETWCKLSGTYSRAQYEVYLTRDESFDFGEVNVGSYVVACGRGTDLLVLRPIRVTGGMEPITIKASSLKPDMAAAN